jgi:tRNA U34 5-methylaminomethyl-2-thiouridine-forming methyltransferase MnmC
MKIVKTHDGSNTLIHESINEHYHSIHGAEQEGRHVFIQNGLALVKNKSEIKVFEMGFGTGLNALLAYEFATKNQTNLTYYSIEAYPLSVDEASQLRYDELIEDESIFKKLHALAWNKSETISSNFTLHKMEGFIEKTSLDFIKPIDVIFYDAFAPSAQAFLWESEILQKMYAILAPEGLLSTYCAKGQFKRNLKEIGFEVSAVPGPPGKREMTIAYKRQS